MTRTIRITEVRPTLDPAPVAPPTPAARPYDWSTDRDRDITVDRSVARYALTQLKANTTPAHPQAHADAIRALTNAVGR